jgi:predicted nucleic acid-binding protein
VRLLLDTSVLVDHLRGDERAVELVLAANRTGDELWGVVLTRTEILRGVRGGEGRATGRLLEALAWQDVTIEIADRAGELARRYRRSHPGVDIVDFVIGATAESLSANLVTRNTKHFPMLPNLAPPY